MNEVKYIGMDVHQSSTSVAVLNAAGQVVTSAVVETRAQALLAFIQGQPGSLHLTFEEGTYSACGLEELRHYINRSRCEIDERRGWEFS